jgi:hypothetical protein
MFGCSIHSTSHCVCLVARFYRFTDPEMCRLAITPGSDVVKFAKIWLQEYFRLYGDESPTIDEVHIAVHYKLDIYKDYKKFMEQTCTPARPVVSANKFRELWRAIYPEFLSRPYADVVGKCRICYSIQNIRQTATDAHSQIAAKEAHIMHRGGCFMLERDA